MDWGGLLRAAWPPLRVRHTSFAGHQKSQRAEQARLQLGRDSLESQALGMDSENPEGKSTIDEQRCMAGCASPEAGPVLWRGAVFGHKGNLYLSVPSSLCAQPRTWNTLLPSSGLSTTCRCTCVLTDTCVSPLGHSADGSTPRQVSSPGMGALHVPRIHPQRYANVTQCLSHPPQPSDLLAAGPALVSLCTEM